MERRHSHSLLLIALAVGLALFVRAMVLGGYRIPSNSMAPVLQGDAVAGDRVLVDRTRFARRAPSRWMLAVFTRPDDDRAYVKRLVGLPGDELLIRDGDLYNHGALVIKSDEILEQTLVPVYDETAPFSAFDSFWVVTEGLARPETGGLLVAPGETGAASFQTRNEVTDGYRDRGGTWRAGRNPVGDIEIQLRFAFPAKAGRLEVQLIEGWDRVRVTVAVGFAGRVVLPDGTAVAVPGLRLTPGREHVIRVSNVDERLRIRFDGAAIHAGDYAARDRGEALPERRNLLEIRAFGGPLRVTGLRVRRDLHFVAAGEHAIREPVRVGPDHYFLLGDHSEASDDSRAWGPVPVSGLIGEPVLVFWPPSRFRLL